MEVNSVLYCLDASGYPLILYCSSCVVKPLIYQQNMASNTLHLEYIHYDTYNIGILWVIGRLFLNFFQISRIFIITHTYLTLVVFAVFSIQEGIKISTITNDSQSSEIS
jgi:hypothetical protein